MQSFFKNCNELTIYKIAYEMLTKKEFKVGEKILMTNKRSIINQDHFESLEPQQNLIEKRVLT